MTKPIQLIVNLPFFPGFYDSDLSSAIDYAESNRCEWDSEKEEEDGDEFWPEAVRLDSGDYAEASMAASSYSAAYRQVAEWYADAFDNWAHENLETPEGSFKFESMDSPREYNFGTDRLYVYVPLKVMRDLFKRTKRDELATAIKDRFTSYDGFISHYSNDVNEWELSDLRGLDHNELATILGAAIKSLVPDFDRQDFNREMYDLTMGDEGDYTAADSCVDWPKYEAHLRETRAAKLAKLIEADPTHAAELCDRFPKVAELLSDALSEVDRETAHEWEAAYETRANQYYRCPLTLDLFA